MHLWCAHYAHDLHNYKIQYVRTKLQNINTCRIPKIEFSLWRSIVKKKTYLIPKNNTLISSTNLTFNRANKNINLHKRPQSSFSYFSADEQKVAGLKKHYGSLKDHVTLEWLDRPVALDQGLLLHSLDQCPRHCFFRKKLVLSGSSAPIQATVTLYRAFFLNISSVSSV